MRLLRRFAPRNDVFIAVFLLLSASQSHAEFFVGKGATGAAFLKVPVSARAVALGNAFSPISGDITAIEYNPAGLANIGRVDVSATYLSYVEDVSMQSIAVGFPAGDRGGDRLRDDLFFGLHYRLFKGEDRARNDIGIALNTLQSKDQVIQGSLAYKPVPRLSLGFGGKIISQKLDDESASGFAADGGVLWRAKAALTLGGSLMNVGPSKAFISEKDPLPSTARAGAGYQVGTHVLLILEGAAGRDKIFQKTFASEVTLNRFIQLRGAVFHTTQVEFAGGLGLRFSPNLDRLSSAEKQRQSNRRSLEDLNVSSENPVYKRYSESRSDSVDFGIDYGLRTNDELGISHTITLKILL